jgi:hypothetical protein
MKKLTVFVIGLRICSIAHNYEISTVFNGAYEESIRFNEMMRTRIKQIKTIELYEKRNKI